MIDLPAIEARLKQAKPILRQYAEEERGPFNTGWPFDDLLDDLRALLDEVKRLRRQLAAGHFWKGVYPDGFTAERVAAELSDYHFILEQVPKVYDHVTGGVLSKQNYEAEVVNQVADDYVTKLIQEETDELEKRVQALEGALQAVIRNDGTPPYAHHQARPSDGKRPEDDGGTVWKTPREIAQAALSPTGRG